MPSLFRNLLEKSTKAREIRDENMAPKTTNYSETALAYVSYY
jgi:hypothetical protein